MLNLSVKGSLQGVTPKTYHLVETTWSAWKAAFPESRVLTGKTGSNWSYTSNPYGENYPNDNNNILFPIEREDDRLERKTLAHGIFYKISLLVFPIEEFPDETTIINHHYAGEDFVVAGNAKHDLVVSFSRKTEDGTVLNFSQTSDDLPIIMVDNEGNKWDVFGEAVAGPRKGAKLNTIPSYNAYWFAWADFFANSPKTPTIFYP
jgi:hypothetical protein